MEHTATVSDLIATTDLVPVARTDRRTRLFVGIGATTWVFAMHVASWLACSIAHGITAVVGVVTFLGLAVAAVGIYLGLRQHRQGSRLSAWNCVAPSMAAFCFWIIQFMVRDLPFAG